MKRMWQEPSSLEQILQVSIKMKRQEPFKIKRMCQELSSLERMREEPI